MNTYSKELGKEHNLKLKKQDLNLLSCILHDTYRRVKEDLKQALEKEEKDDEDVIFLTQYKSDIKRIAKSIYDQVDKVDCSNAFNEEEA